MDKNLYFGMLDLVEVVLHGIFVYMVQKYLVDNNHHHLMINNKAFGKVYYKVFYVYLHKNMWVIIRIYRSCYFFVEIFVSVKINDFEYLGEKI